MIEDQLYKDILDSPCQTLVCPVNVDGVMGAGLALQFKKRYPLMFEQYKAACRANAFAREKFLLYDTGDGHKVLCFPTKRSWKNPSQMAFIDEGLYQIAVRWRECGITSLAMPAIGCGLGGLDWDRVADRIETYLGEECELPVTIYLTAPMPLSDLWQSTLDRADY